MSKPSDEQFTWKCKNGKTIELPSLATLDPDVGAAEDLAMAAQGDNDLISMGMHIRFLTSALRAEDGAKLRQLKASEFGDFMTAWSEHSGVSAGESPAS